MSLVKVAAVIFLVSIPSSPTIKSPGFKSPNNCDVGLSEWIIGPSGVVSIIIPNGPAGAVTSKIISFLLIALMGEPKL
jgi:hypothetical protein